jgi:hypothetical protein
MTRKQKKAFTNHCMRMNEAVLLRNNKLSDLTESQYESFMVRTANTSYQKMEQELG